MLYTRNWLLNEFKIAMQDEFEMTDLGSMKYFLGLEIDQSENGIFISQKKYAKDVLKRFRMDNCNPANTPIVTGTQLSKSDKGGDINPTLYKKLIGSLMYLTTTRPDIMYAVSLLSRFMESPKDTHWKVGKRILRYIAGSVNEGICYTSSENDCLIGYTDNDFAGSIDDEKAHLVMCSF
jgi:hypothetical protein